MVLPLIILMNISMMIPDFGKVSGVRDLDELVVYGGLILAMLANLIQAWVIQQALFQIYSMLLASVNAIKKTIAELRVLGDDLKLQIDNLKQKLERLSAQVDRFSSENGRLEKQVGGDYQSGFGDLFRFIDPFRTRFAQYRRSHKRIFTRISGYIGLVL